MSVPAALLLVTMTGLWGCHQRIRPVALCAAKNDAPVAKITVQRRKIGGRAAIPKYFSMSSKESKPRYLVQSTYASRHVTADTTDMAATVVECCCS